MRIRYASPSFSPLSDERFRRTRFGMRSSATVPVTIGVVTTGSVGVIAAAISMADRRGMPSSSTAPVATANITTMPTAMLATIQRRFARQYPRGNLSATPSSDTASTTRATDSSTSVDPRPHAVGCTTPAANGPSRAPQASAIRSGGTPVRCSFTDRALSTNVRAPITATAGIRPLPHGARPGGSPGLAPTRGYDSASRTTPSALSMKPGFASVP